MRNGTRVGPDTGASLPEDPQPIQLDQATVSRKSAKSPEAAPTASQAPDFNSTSFSFAVERTATPDAAARSRMTSFPKLETSKAEAPRVEKPVSRESLSTRASVKRSGKPTTPNSSKATIVKAKARGGMRTLLDKYISFVAGILKAIERFLLRRFTGNNPTQQQTQNQATEKEESTQPQQPQKSRNQRHVRGPGTSI